MRVDEFPESMSDYDAAGLVLYAPHWSIWRGERDDGLPGSWCATRRTETAGASAAVVRDSARQLADALAEQAREADAPARRAQARTGRR
jgi:hypothetical protein